MKVRYLGHSCVEIIGRHHILIDPDYTRDPEPDVEYTLVTHAHRDHIGRLAEVTSGSVIASPDVCEIAVRMGIGRERLLPVMPGKQIDTIQVLPGYSLVNDPLYLFFYVLARRRFPDAGGTPLSFLVKDEATLLHIGDAHKAPLPVRPDILCLPWRMAPFGGKRYQAILTNMAKQFSAPYVLPIHYDLPHFSASPQALNGRLSAEILDGNGWYSFHNRCRVEGED